MGAFIGIAANPIMFHDEPSSLQSSRSVSQSPIDPE